MGITEVGNLVAWCTANNACWQKGEFDVVAVSRLITASLRYNIRALTE